MSHKIKRETLRHLVADYTAGELGPKPRSSRRAWPQNIVDVLNDSTKVVYAGGILRVDGFLYPGLNAEEAEESYRTYGAQVVGKDVTRFGHEIRVTFADCCEKGIVRPAWLPGIFGDYVYELKAPGDDNLIDLEYHHFVRYDTEQEESTQPPDDPSYLAEYRGMVERPYRLIGSYGGPWEIVARSEPSDKCGERRHFCLLRPAWTDIRIGSIGRTYHKTDDPKEYTTIMDQERGISLAQVILNNDTQHPFYCHSPLQEYDTKIGRGITVAIAVDQAGGQTNIISAECF
ncbi:MAG: hypothetical protein PHQ75_00635 [Thermoguttaceae bacterium]|nr:hypothetical protein [Thermoguttaceae bacterium]